MFRKLVFTAGATLSIPTAFADDKFKPVYDDEVPSIQNPLPGTIDAAKEAPNVLSDLESKVDKDLEVKTYAVGGTNMRFSEVLEDTVRRARKALDSTIAKADSVSSDVVDNFYKGEHSVVETLNGVHAKSEPVLPNAIYILVAGLAGTIAARRHNFLVRTALPLATGTGAFAFTMPQTFSNTRALVWKYEQKKVPEFAEAHAAASKKAEDLKTSTVGLIDNGEKHLNSTVHSARKTLKDWTGIDLSGK